MPLQVYFTHILERGSDLFRLQTLILIDWPSWIVLLIVSLCAFTDLRKGKIYNQVTYVAILLGIVLNVFAGLSSLAQSLIGVTGILITFGILRRVGAMAAGDVKLLTAIGAFKGLSFVLYSSFYIFLFASLIGIIVLAWKGRLFPAVKWISGTMLSVCVPGIKRPEYQGEMTTMPFGPAIFLGTVCSIYLEKINGTFTF